MAEYAPQAIKDMFDRIEAGIPSAIMAGIVGDAAHTYGYHRCRNVAAPDYSTELPPDKKGDAEAACALDISWSKASDQYTVSRRLLDAKNDSRMAPIREFYGSTDGYNVCGWDYYGGYAVTSDDSHLWHIHLSILRQYSNDTTALAKVADVITGGAAPPPEEDDMKLTSYYCGGTQALTKGTWRTLSIDDDGAQSIIWGPADFHALAQFQLDGLPAGKAIKIRLYEIDVDDNGADVRGHAYTVGEIIGTSGGTMGQHVQYGHTGSPAKGYDSRRLRLEALSDEADGVKLSKLSTRVFK